MATPRDFLEGDYNPTKQQYRARDFLSNEEPDETLGQSAKYAPFRIGEDLLKAGKSALESTPEYWEKGKTEIPAILNPINGLRHPVSRTKNVIAGLAELGHNTINTPYNLTNYLENRLKLLPKGAADKVKSFLYQNDISEALNQFTGNEMNPGDALTRGLVRNATNIIPAGKVAGALNPLNLTAKSIAKDVLKTREKNIGHYGNRYENLWKEAESEGLGDLAHATNKTQANIPFEKYDVGPLFGVSHNSTGTVMPTNNLGMRVEGNKARVISSKVALDQRGKGIGKALYKEAIEDATKKGLGFESDSIVSQEALNVYKALEKEGYKFKFNPEVKETLVNHEGNHYKGLASLDEESPVVELISKPKPKNSIDIDMETIKKYSPGRGIKGLEDFESNPTLQNAHNAKSDLLRIKRDLDKLTTLRTAERQQLNAVNNAIDSINNNMFKGPDGKIHEGLKKKYNEIQEGYRNEVVPYKNKAINEFMRGESSADELVNSLSKKAFYAKRGKYHNSMRVRKLLKKHPYLAGIGTGSALGAGALGFYDELFGKNK